jgi:2-oxoglutarate ferredoxin oxidoreductase subunit gamma
MAVSICGVGGQGVVLAGVILGEAAVTAGRWACQTAAYTVAARGGFAKSEVVVADGPQASPLPEALDVVIGLADEGWRPERRRLLPGGLAILDTDVEAGEVAGRLIRLPLGEIARRVGRPRSVNLVALGALIGITGVLPAAAVVHAIGQALEGRAGDIAAFEAGLAAGRECGPGEAADAP